MSTESEVDRLTRHSEELRAVLHAQTRLLDALIHEIVEAGDARRSTWDNDVVRVVPMMLQSLGVSVHSVLKLSNGRDMAIRDAYGIARSVSELAVNIAYIVACGSDVAKRAQRHALQKSYRDLRRSGEIGDVRIEISRSSITDIKDVPGLAEALAEFTGKKGQELADWTQLSISERIEEVKKVNEKAALSLAGSISSVYRHSSELLHGTYFGVLHFWRGSGQLVTSRELFSERWEEHFMAVFTALFFGVGGVLELASKLFDLPEIKETQDSLLRKTSAWVEKTNSPVEPVASAC